MIAFFSDRSITASAQHKGHFPLGRIFRAERHFLLFKDQLAESGRQKTKENIVPRGKFRPVETGLKAGNYDMKNYLWSVFNQTEEKDTSQERFCQSLIDPRPWVSETKAE